MVCDLCGGAVENGKCTICGKVFSDQAAPAQQNSEQPIPEPVQQNTEQPVPEPVQPQSPPNAQAPVQGTIPPVPQPKRLREKSWFIILLLIFFFPVGLYLMWKYANWNKVVKIIVTAVILLSALSGAFGSKGSRPATTSTTNTNTSTQVEDTEPEPAEPTRDPDATVESITATYNGSTAAGTVINNDSPFDVVATYSDNFTETVSDWAVTEEKTLEVAKVTQVEISYEGKTVTVDIQGDVPTEYRNALRKAQQYSDMMHMSKQGIYDQLTSDYGEGFEADAAQYAIDNVSADWKANALAKAKDYRDTMSMSKNSVYDQLVSSYGEKFTAEEAQYAVDHLDD